MYFDTHCHLNFKAFEGRVEEVINDAKKAGVNNIIVPGTDVPTSIKAVGIASFHPHIYAAVGIHPHHVFEFIQNHSSASQFFSRENKVKKIAFASEIKKIENLLKNPKVVAVGEIGIDKHYYQKTKHKDYKINDEFINLQKDLFIEQIKLANKYKKSLIIHNREAKDEVLNILTSHQSLITNHRSVFHCCEPDKDLLDFAIAHEIFIGIDGDITYRKDKQEFIKMVPLNLLVLETDSPFLIPELSGSRSWTRYNEPKNIPLIAEFIVKLLNCSVDLLKKQTTENASKLFKINNK